MAIKFPGNTIRLSDTVDQYARRVHINVRNGKVTLVYRWKDRKSTKAHTQRVTLDDTQTGRLTASIAVAGIQYHKMNHKNLRVIDPNNFMGYRRSTF